MSNKSYKLIIASKNIREYRIGKDGITSSTGLWEVNKAIGEEMEESKYRVINRKTMAHNDCDLARGTKLFKCLICNEDSHNYFNGIDVCRDCCIKYQLCCICGDFGTIVNDLKRRI